MFSECKNGENTHSYTVPSNINRVLVIAYASMGESGHKANISTDKGNVINIASISDNTGNPNQCNVVQIENCADANITGKTRWYGGFMIFSI